MSIGSLSDGGLAFALIHEMVTHMSRLLPVGRFVILAFLILLVSCTPIRKISDIRVVDPGGLDALMFGEYWTTHSFSPANAAQREKPLVIAEFCVEFVREMVAIVPDSHGVSERKMDYGSLLETIPDQLHNLLLDRLDQSGRTVLALSAVTASAAYSNYEFRAKDHPRSQRHQPPIRLSGGRVRLTELRPSTALQIIDGSEEQSREVDKALAKELGAAAVLRVRFRIGVHKGRATIESGSRIRVTRADGESGYLLSERTLAGARSVLDDYSYLPNASGIYRIRVKTYQSEMGEIFPAYAGLAARAIR